MKALDCIKERSYFLSEGGDVVCLFKQGTTNGAFTLSISSDEELIQSLTLTSDMIYDAAYLGKSAFASKYKDVLKNDNIPIQQCYLRIRDWIVDEAIPLKKKIRKKKPTGVSRIDQVKNLMSQGITSPAKIAKQIGTNPSYVHTLINKINASNN